MKSLLIFLVLLVAESSLGQDAPSLSDLAETRGREQAMRLLLEAARSKSFYVVADGSSSTLSLGLSGVTLAQYSLQSIELGFPATGASANDDPLAVSFTCRSPRRDPKPLPEEGEALAGKSAPDGEPASREQVLLDCAPPLEVQLVSSARLGILERLRDRIRLPGQPRIPRARIVVTEADAPRLLAALPEETIWIFSPVPLLGKKVPETPGPTR